MKVSPTKAQLSITKGSVVKYTKDDGSTFLAVARTEPQKLGGHSWVIWLEGISGCVLLSRCKPEIIRPVQFPQK